MSDEELELNKKICFDKEGVLHGFNAHDPSLENSLILIKKIFSLINLNKNKEFLDVIENTLNDESNNTDLFYMLGFALLENGKLEESVKVFNKFIEIDPENKWVWLGKVRALIELERYEEALESSEKAIEIYEKDPITINNEASSVFLDVWSYKGESLSKLKRYKEALETYEQLIVIEPKNVRGWIGKFNILWKNHENEKALEAIDKAIFISELEDKVSLWELKGHFLLLNENYIKALEAYEKAIEINKENAHLWTCKGIVFLKLEAYNYALKSYEKAITIEPKDASAWKFRSIALLNLGRHTECQEAFEQALYLNPEDSQICNILADYHLMFGDIENAYKYVDNALLIDKDNAVSLYIKGKIKIEEQDYTTSIRCFNKAISLDLRNPIYLLWDSYAKYLMAELELSSDEKKYQDAILGIIRELERINNCDVTKEINSKKISYWFFDIVPYRFKNLIIYLLEYIKKILIYLNISEKNIVKSLGMIYPILNRFKNIKNMEYNYYFLGCFYYKIGDNLTAIDYFKQCNKLIPNSEISRSASELLNNIWNTKIKPSFLRWWLYSPSNQWFKRILFVLFSSSLFGILLPSIASKILDLVYNLVFKPIFTYQPLAVFTTIKSIMSTVLLSLGSIVSSVNWAENTVQLTLLTVTIIFILISPNTQHFKSSQIEIEVRPPPAFELFPSLIGKRLHDLDNLLKLL